jgi:hypothetical protein
MRQTLQQKNKAPNYFKRQIVEQLKGLETGDRELLAAINPNKHIQHNLHLVDSWRDFASVWKLFPRELPRSIRCAFFRMATLSLPIPNTTSTVPRWVLIFSDLKTERSWSTGTTCSRPPPSGVRAATR